MKSGALILLGLILCWMPSSLYAGKMELTTYYPAPYGEYKQVQAIGADTNNGNVALSARGSAGPGFVVTNANQVGIGTASPGHALEVAGDIQASSIISDSTISAVGNITSSSTISADGDISADGFFYGAGFFYTSDARLKENIVPLAGSLEKIERLRGVLFTFKDRPGEKNLGLIAQEVESVVPEIVRTQADGMKAVAYASLTALLIEGMKEQQREISVLREELAQVKSTVASGGKNVDSKRVDAI